jgi:hypothetical protein
VLPLFAVALGARVAHADPELFVELEYLPDAALAGCPSDAAFRTMISAQLGYDPFRAGAAQRVVARAHAADHGLRGVVEWYDASGGQHGERELASENTDCAALARAMSFAIAVQIQLLAQETASQSDVLPSAPSSDQPSDESRSSARTAAPPSRREDTRPPVAERSSEEHTAWQFMLGAGPALAFGLAPRPAVEGRVFGGMRRGRVAFELGAEASLPSHYATTNGDGFDQHVIAGSVAGCAVFGGASGCVVTKLGKVYVRGVGVDLPNADSGGMAQIGPRFAWFHGLGDRWFGALRVEALATLVSWEVTLNEREVWKTPLFSLSVGGDLGVFFQ